MYYGLAVALCVAAIIARVAIARTAAASAVDQHYWIVAAKAYREQRGLPVSIPGKYLMECEEQAYPPLFGILLGRVLGSAAVRYATFGIEVAELLLLAGVMVVLGLPLPAVAVALAFYVSAPILVVYNAQLTPRILGDFFLFFAMACQVVANLSDFPEFARVGLWITSAIMLALMFMTHKMTYQLHLVLLPFWAWALQSWLVPLASIGGVIIYVALVGYRFAVFQLKAHVDIVRFWNRNWRNLGAHQFHHSPIYGPIDQPRTNCFHAPGWGGALKHIRVVISYAPVAVFLPVCSLLSGYSPPGWLLVWFCVTYAWVLVTLYIPSLKCFGGGHLYVFNAIIPCALYVAFLPENALSLISLAAAAMLTVTALYFAWRTVKCRPISRATDFDDALAYLETLPPNRVAVFPLQAAESVAAKTSHAVLWGGHSFGFNQLEGFFPVLSESLSTILPKHRVKLILWDSEWWPMGEKTLKNENLLQDSSKIMIFGKWRLVTTQPIEKP